MELELKRPGFFPAGGGHFTGPAKTQHSLVKACLDGKTPWCCVCRIMLHKVDVFVVTYQQVDYCDFRVALSDRKSPLSLKRLPEIFVSSKVMSSAVSKAAKGGRLRKIGSRLYTRNLTEAAEQIVRRNWHALLKDYFPDALISDRTALENRPAADGSVFIISSGTRTVALPGITFRPRKGRPPLDNDFPFLGDIRLCSAPRAWLENMRRSRKRGAEVARTLSKAELEERLDGLLRQGGEAALNRLRDDARDVSQKLDMAEEFRSLDELIGTFLGTRKARLETAVGQARKRGLPYDPDRLVLFQSLFAELRARAPVTRPSRSMVDSAKTNLAFFESYFSISVRQEHSPGSSARFCPEIHRLHSVGGFRFSQSGFASHQCVHGCERGGR